MSFTSSALWAACPADLEWDQAPRLRHQGCPLMPHLRSDRLQAAPDTCIHTCARAQPPPCLPVAAAGKNFTEGWVEFADKRVAKRTALALNGQRIGGKRRSAYYDDLWCIKYLPRFKWDDLTEEIAYQRAVGGPAREARGGLVSVNERGGWVKSLCRQRRLCLSLLLQVILRPLWSESFFLFCVAGSCSDCVGNV